LHHFLGRRQEGKPGSIHLKKNAATGEKRVGCEGIVGFLGTVISREDCKQAIPTRHHYPKSYRDCQTKSFFRENHQALTLTLKLRPLSSLFARTRLLL